jgi:outer membrane protein assembly factor BamB
LTPNHPPTPAPRPHPLPVAGALLVALLLSAFPPAATVFPQMPATPIFAGWSEPTVADGIAYVGVWLDPGGDLLLALDPATGAERWRYATRRGVSASPIVVDGVVYVTDGFYDQALTGDGAAHALDAASGAECWCADTNAGGATVTDGAIYVRGTVSD